MNTLTMASVIEPPFSTSFFSNNSISYSHPHLQFKLLHTNNFSQKFMQTPLLLQSKHNSTVCTAAIEPPPDQNQSPSESVSLEVSSTTRDRRKIVRVAWEKLLRWSRSLRSKAKTDVLERTNKVIFLILRWPNLIVFTEWLLIIVLYDCITLAYVENILGTGEMEFFFD